MNPFRLLKAMFTSAPRVAAADCFAQVRAGTAVLIDVREPDEARRGVAESARLLPLSDLTGSRRKWKPFLADHADKDLFLYCGAGVRSGMAARILRREGFRATNAGSFAEWSTSGWPTVKPN